MIATKRVTCPVCGIAVEYNGRGEMNAAGEPILAFHYTPRIGKVCDGTRRSLQEMERKGLASAQRPLDLGDGT